MALDVFVAAEDSGNLLKPVASGPRPSGGGERHVKIRRGSRPCGRGKGHSGAGARKPSRRGIAEARKEARQAEGGQSGQADATTALEGVKDLRTAR